MICDIVKNAFVLRILTSSLRRCIELVVSEDQYGCKEYAVNRKQDLHPSGANAAVGG